MAFLNGKVALVTGGSRGIGRAIAHALAAEGAAVAITGRDEAHLADARRTLEEAAAAVAGRPGSPGRIDARRADVRSYDDIDAAVRGTVDRFGGLDILVNNAGVGVFTNVSDMTPSQWADVIDTNLTGVFNACHAALPHLRRRGGGYIINISSLSGTNPFAGAAAYCASKAGLNAFTEALMQEVRYDGIRVSYVMPGSVATEFSGNAAAAGADWKIAPTDVADVVVNLLRQDPRSLPSRVELRPSKPPRKK
jgi:3-oxoacyl-[acyl-carrier protein] reductase